MRFPAFFASLMTDSLIIGSFLVLRTCKQSLNDVIQKIELLQDYQTHIKHRSIADCDCGCKKSRRQWPQPPHELFSNGFGCISSYSRTAAFQGGSIGKQYGRKDGDDLRFDIPIFIRQPHSCRHVSFPQKKSICGRSVSTWLKSTQDCRFKSDKRQTRCWQRFEGRNSCRCCLTNITPLSYFFFAIRQTYSVADPGEGHCSPLFWDQIEAQRAVIKFLFETPLPLMSGSGWPGAPYLKVWIRNWYRMPWINPSL